MIETVDVRFGVNGTVMNDSWTGIVSEAQIVAPGPDGGMARVRINQPDGQVTVLYSSAYRIVRRDTSEVDHTS